MLIAIKYNSYLHSYYAKLKARRGTGKAIIATARKFRNTIFTQAKERVEF